MALNLSGKETNKQSLVVNVETYLTGKTFDIEDDIVSSIQYCQREYEWEQQHVLDLWYTIFKEEYPEIGNIITQPLTGSEPTRISILDGQQRTITLSFMALALEHILEEKRSLEKYKERESLEQQNFSPREIDTILKKYDKYSDSANTLRRMLTYEAHNSEIPKLVFDNSSEFNAFYEKLLNNREDIVNIVLNGDRQNKIIEAMAKKLDCSQSRTLTNAFASLYYIIDAFKGYFDIKDKDHIGASLDTINSGVLRFFKTLITVEMFGIKMNPSIIFENRNNKGKKLNPLSILKNAFIIAKNKHDLALNIINTAQKNEKEINNFFKIRHKHENEQFNKFVYAQFRILYPRETEDNAIISLEKLTIFLNTTNTDPAINNNAWSTTKTVAFYDILKQKKPIFDHITSLAGTKNTEFNVYLYILQKLNLISLYTPILLKMYPTTDSASDRQRFINLLIDIIKTFLMAVYHARNNFYIANNLFKQRPLMDIITRLSSEKLSDVIKEKLSLNKKIDPANLAEIVNEYTFSLDARKGILFLYELLIKYNITKISDFKALDGLFISMTSKLEVEHIIPRNPKTPHNIKDFELDRLGNLLLLESKANELASNNTFKEKLKVYEKKKGVFKQIEEICQLSDFSTIADIDTRSNQIVTRLYKTFGLI